MHINDFDEAMELKRKLDAFERLQNDLSRTGVEISLRTVDIAYEVEAMVEADQINDEPLSTERITSSVAIELDCLGDSAYEVKELCSKLLLDALYKHVLIVIVQLSSELSELGVSFDTQHLDIDANSE